MKDDRAFSIFLAILFGVLGIVILTLTWMRPMPGIERVLSTGIGAGGALISVIKVRRFKLTKDNLDESPIKVEVKEKP